MSFDLEEMRRQTETMLGDMPAERLLETTILSAVLGEWGRLLDKLPVRMKIKCLATLVLSQTRDMDSDQRETFISDLVAAMIQVMSLIPENPPGKKDG